MVASAAALHADPAASPDELIEQNVGFAPSLVRRLAYRLPSSVGAEELESDGYLGLMMSARTFDAERGVQFRTYAAKRIYGQMLDGIRNRTICRWPATLLTGMEYRGARGESRESGSTVELRTSGMRGLSPGRRSAGSTGQSMRQKPQSAFGTLATGLKPRRRLV